MPLFEERLVFYLTGFVCIRTSPTPAIRIAAIVWPEKP